MYNKTLFSQIFNSEQSSNVPGNSEETVFSARIPNGYIGFLTAMASTYHDNTLWSWYIDGEKVVEQHNALDNIQMPTSFDPPFLVKKLIEAKCVNNNAETILLKVFCNGECYPLPEPLALQPIRQNETNQLLNEIKTELQSTKPVGEVTDEYFTVTDTVAMIDGRSENTGQKDLDWTTCAIMNQGPNNVYVAVNEWKRPEAPLLVGESMNIDLSQRGSIKRLFFVCDAGETATVRVHVIK